MAKALFTVGFVIRRSGHLGQQASFGQVRRSGGRGRGDFIGFEKKLCIVPIDVGTSFRIYMTTSGGRG